MKQSRTIQSLVVAASVLLPALLVLLPGGVLAAEQMTQHLELTGHWVGWLSICLFLLAYLLVMAEEFTHLRKSKPVIGMLTGLGYWQIFGFVLKKTCHRYHFGRQENAQQDEQLGEIVSFDVFPMSTTFR